MVFLAIAAGAEPPPAGAAGRTRPEGRGVGPDHGEALVEAVFRNEKLAAELNLSQPQKDALKAMHAGSRAAMEELEVKLQEAAVRQARLMLADEIDEEAVLAAVEEIGQIRTQIAKTRMQHLVGIRRNLTAEQRALLGGIMRERWRRERGAKGEGPRGEERKGEGAGRPGGGPRGELPKLHGPSGEGRGPGAPPPGEGQR